MVSDGSEYYYFFRQKFLTPFLKFTATIFCLLVSLLQPVGSQHLPSTPITVGYRDFNYGRTPNAVITETKPESKLWFNDGFWWGSLFDPISENYRIHQFDVPSQCWVNVGPDIDDRDNTLADALWDGTQLYIVSHVKDGRGGSTSSAKSARLYRYSYDSISDTYSLDAGFPVNINSHTSEALVLTKDSTGQLWVTWTLSDRNVWLNRTVGDDQTWGEPFILPSMEEQIDLDDISGILAFGDNKIGVMWSNQVERNIFFAVHIDSSADTEWEPQEAAIENSDNELVSDDHLNLSMACSGDGKTVVAVTKSSLSDLDEPKVYFLKRSPDGQWSETVFGFLRDRHTRPIVLVNSDTDSVYVLAKSGPNSEKIYIKSAHLDNPQFESGRGTLFIASKDDRNINNATSTKQCVNSETGLLVIASDNSSRHYFHNYLSLDLPTQRTLSTSISPSGTGTIALSPDKPTYHSGEQVELTAIATPGYQFLNWAGDIGAANATSDTITLVMDQGRTVTANFVSQKFTLIDSVSPEGSGSIERSPDKPTYDIGESVILTASANETFVFSGWSGDIGSADSTANPLTIVMDQDRTVTANFGLQQFTLIDSVSPAGSGSIERSPDKPTYNIGESVILTASANETFVFSGWSGDIGPADSTANPLTIVMDQDRHVTANFDSIPQFTLTASVSGDGNINLSPDKPTYTEGETVTLTATPDPGYDFVNWNGDIGDATATDSAITVEMTQNRSITANFAKQFTLVVDTDLPRGGKIEISPDKPVYVDGDSVTLTANANVAFSFLKWSGDIGAADSTDNPLTIEMSENRNITAAFAAIARGLKGRVNDEEEVSGNQSDSGLPDKAGNEDAPREEINNVPEVFSLLQNYPNPFNIETNIEYTLPHHASVNLSIFNLHGRLIRRLVDGTQDAGYKKVRWNGRDSSGIEVSSGIYFVRLRAADKIFTMKILLQK